MELSEKKLKTQNITQTIYLSLLVSLNFFFLEQQICSFLLPNVGFLKKRVSLVLVDPKSLCSCGPIYLEKWVKGADKPQPREAGSLCRSGSAVSYEVHFNNNLTCIWRKHFFPGLFFSKFRVHIKDDNNSPHGKIHRFLFPFSSKFPD